MSEAMIITTCIEMNVLILNVEGGANRPAFGRDQPSLVAVSDPDRPSCPLSDLERLLPFLVVHLEHSMAAGPGRGH